MSNNNHRYVIQNSEDEYWTGDGWGHEMAAEVYHSLDDLPAELHPGSMIYEFSEHQEPEVLRQHDVDMDPDDPVIYYYSSWGEEYDASVCRI